MAKTTTILLLGAGVLGLWLYTRLPKKHTPQTSGSIPNTTQEGNTETSSKLQTNTGELGISAASLLSGNKTTLNEVLAEQLPKVAPFTISSAPTRILTGQEIALIQQYALGAGNKNMFVQSIARQAITTRTISNNDIHVLSLNPMTEPLALQLAKVTI